MLGKIAVSSFAGVVIFGITLFYLFLPLSVVLVPSSAATTVQYSDIPYEAMIEGLIRLFVVSPFALFLAGLVSGGISVVVKPANEDLDKVVIAGMTSGFMVGVISIILGWIVLIGAIGIVSSLPIGIGAGVVSLIGGLCGVFIVHKIRQW